MYGFQMAESGEGKTDVRNYRGLNPKSSNLDKAPDRFHQIRRSLILAMVKMSF